MQKAIRGPCFVPVLDASNAPASNRLGVNVNARVSAARSATKTIAQLTRTPRHRKRLVPLSLVPHEMETWHLCDSRSACCPLYALSPQRSSAPQPICTPRGEWLHTVQEVSEVYIPPAVQTVGPRFAALSFDGLEPTWPSFSTPSQMSAYPSHSCDVQGGIMPRSQTSRRC